MPPPRAGVRHQHGVAAGERQVRRQRRALVAALLLDDLHQDDLAALDDFLDLVAARTAARARRAAPRARPRRCRPARRARPRRRGAVDARPRCDAAFAVGRGSAGVILACRRSSRSRPRPSSRLAASRRRRTLRSSPARDEVARPRASDGFGERAVSGLVVARRSSCALVAGLVAVAARNGCRRRTTPPASLGVLAVVIACAATGGGAPALRLARRQRPPRPLPRAPPPRAAPAGRRPGSGSSRGGFR